ncbi:MAG: ATP-binding protein, partial [bacterium]|nr:ATP-binding protein [bacterium]
MTLYLLLWVDFAYLPRLIGMETPDLALTFLKVSWFVTPLFFAFLYFLIVYLTEKEEKYSLLSKFVLFFGILTAFVTGFTDFIVESIRFVGPYMAINYGRGMMFFLAVIIFMILATLYPLFKEYFRAKPALKLKLQYVLVGVFIFYLANVIFNIGLPILFDIVRFYWIGDYSTIFLLAAVSYAAVARQLFNIKIILSQALVGLIAIVLLTQTASASGWFDFSGKFILFLIFLILGCFLVKSVELEIKRREELETLTYQLETVNVKLTMAYKELEKLDKAKSEFISIASHQLRTPLTAIKGYLSMILDGVYGKISQKIKKPMESVYQSNERLIKLVNDLLNLSRLDAGKVKFEPAPASLEKIIKDIVRELRLPIENKGLYIKMEELKSPLPQITVDQDHIRQAVLNIIDNATKYTEKGGITIELLKIGNKAQIKISDTGQGMSKEELGGLFQMFSRATAGNQFHAEGAGIGLYIAKKFVEMHKGRIYAESKGNGEGSIFKIDLPIE